MIRALYRGYFLLLLALTAVTPASSQVAVKVSLNGPDYLVGEPIVVNVAFTNIGTESLGYSGCDGRADLTIIGVPPEQPPLLRGCPWGGGPTLGGSACGIDHPPGMAPGQTITFPYLLKSYHLLAGSYLLHASGRAPVRWFFGPGLNSSPVSQRKLGDPVEGAAFDVSLNLNVSAGTEEELRQRYLTYITDSESVGDIARHAREAIAEMAPPFLEKTILGFTNHPGDEPLVVKGLGQIPTPESRADLIALFEKSPDLNLRALIAEKLAAIATPRELPFFASLLPGHSSVLDDRLRVFAALGIGRIGGNDAVKALQSVPLSASSDVRSAAAAALGNTRSQSAVTALIGMEPDPWTQNDVCWALATLTHYQWCGGPLGHGNNGWRNWWRTHASSVPIYGTDQCPDLKSLRLLKN